MTAELISRPGVRPVARLIAIPVIPTAAFLVVGLRLLFATRPASPDEAGFLMVASQWHVGGHSLYGNYWVDRPPLLIGLFRIADLSGGLVALRVLGALAAAATVVLLASAARRAFGRRAGAWTAVVAAALLVTPFFGAQAVNGELLAAPFIALGIRLVVETIENHDALAAQASAMGAGVAAVLALLVKQNMADVVVFAVVCWLIAWRSRRITGRLLADMVALAVAGGLLAYAVVMLWAMAHGTSPLGVYEATYPFRIKAGHVLAATPGDSAEVRLNHLGLSFLLTGAPLLLLAFLAFGVRRSRQAPVVWAIIAAGAFATASILMGGSYWLHYLIELVPTVSLAAGALALSIRPVLRVLVPVVVASTLVVTTISLANPAPAPGNTIGEALAAAAQPGDTVLSAFGDADIPRDAGMSSPYPYLWSLPSRTLDPDLTLLRGILAGTAAPTWVVVRGPRTLGRLHEAGVATLIESRYRLVTEICSRSIYLLRGTDRPVPVRTSSCGGTVLP